MFKDTKDRNNPRMIVDDDDGFFWDYLSKNWFKEKTKVSRLINNQADFRSIIQEGSLFNPEKHLVLDLRKMKKDKLKDFLSFKIPAHVSVLLRVSKLTKAPDSFALYRFPKAVKFADRSKLIRDLLAHFSLNSEPRLDSLLNDFELTSPSRIARLFETWQLQFPREKKIKNHQIRQICQGQNRKSVFFDLAREFEKEPARRNKLILKEFISQQENVLGLLGFLFNKLGRGERLAISLDKLLELESALKFGKPEYLMLGSFYLNSGRK